MHRDRPCVIFDVDGVLVDSYQAHFHSWLALADDGNCPRMTEDEFRATFGRTTRETIAQLWPSQQWTRDEIVRLDDRKEELFRELLSADFQAMPGAASLIVSLKDAGFGLAAGSSGPPDNVFLVLDQLACRKYFDVVVTAVDVSRGKPDPEVFLTCARRLGVSGATCAVIEDAVVGVTAANRAGAMSIALVTEGREVSLFEHADHIVRELAALSPELIRNWLGVRHRQVS